MEQLLTISNFDRAEVNGRDIEVDNDYYLDPSQALGKDREMPGEEMPEATFGDLWGK